jgi:predicted Rossmann-fold nucleotide-binding protein
VLVDRDHWRGLEEWVQGALVANGLVTASDLGMLVSVHSPEAVVEALRRVHAVA